MVFLFSIIIFFLLVIVIWSISTLFCAIYNKVAKGQIIAKLDTSQTKAQKAVLIAQKERAIATLKELQTGPRVEVIAATRASLTQEQAKLQELQTGPRVEVIAATRASLAQELAKLQELQTGTRTEDIEAARSAVLDLEEQVELAQLREKRREELYKQGAISQEQLDEASTQTDTLNARLKRGRSELEKLQTGTRHEQIEAQKARVRLGDVRGGSPTPEKDFFSKL